VEARWLDEMISSMEASIARMRTGESLDEVRGAIHSYRAANPPSIGRRRSPAEGDGQQKRQVSKEHITGTGGIAHARMEALPLGRPGRREIDLWGNEPPLRPARIGKEITERVPMTEAELLARITSNPSIFGGKPIIRGRRIAVEHILDMLAAGDSVETILEGYPFLQKEDVQACLIYARKLVGHERIESFSVETAS